MFRASQFYHGARRTFIGVSNSNTNTNGLLQISRLQVIRTENPRPLPNWKTDELRFGQYYTDHMLEVDFDKSAGGWKEPHIRPFGDVTLHPGSQVLQYAMTMFDGLKAFRGSDGRIRLFRPKLHYGRMLESAARAGLPSFNTSEFAQCLHELVQLDERWVPENEHGALYIRPNIIGMDHTFSVTNSKTAKMFVIMTPVVLYSGLQKKPISVFADARVSRTFPGGTGRYKLGCNYAPNATVNTLAQRYGCDNVLWLYMQQRFLLEMANMNIFVYWVNEKGEKELCTPPLDDGLVLRGVTRQTLLDLASEWDSCKVNQRYISLSELRMAIADMRLIELFGSGTSVGIQPVNRIVLKRNDEQCEVIDVPYSNSKTNMVARLQKAISDIQRGRVDREDWIQVVT